MAARHGRRGRVWGPSVNQRGVAKPRRQLAEWF